MIPVSPKYFFTLFSKSTIALKIKENDTDRFSGFIVSIYYINPVNRKQFFFFI